MAYVIPAGSTFEIQIVGRVDGQTTRNVYHYWYPTGGEAIGDGKAAAQALILAFGATVYDESTLLQSNLWTLQYLQGQWIMPIRYRSIQMAAADAGVSPGGQITAASLPSNSSACVSLYCLKSGRTFQGRKFVPGIAVTRVAASKLDVTGLGLLSNAALSMLGDQDDGDGHTVVPVLLKKGTNPITERVIFEATARDTIRCARRRTVGRGE